MVSYADQQQAQNARDLDYVNYLLNFLFSNSD